MKFPLASNWCAHLPIPLAGAHLPSPCGLPPDAHLPEYSGRTGVGKWESGEITFGKRLTRPNGIYNKVDIIMHGMETIGSAERSCDKFWMRNQFHTISDGEYANLLFNHFGKKRVEDELEEQEEKVIFNIHTQHPNKKIQIRNKIKF